MSQTATTFFTLDITTNEGGTLKISDNRLALTQHLTIQLPVGSSPASTSTPATDKTVETFPNTAATILADITYRASYRLDDRPDLDAKQGNTPFVVPLLLKVARSVLTGVGQLAMFVCRGIL
ncbi:hypothetical protein MD484_g2184, partial [Candolleomyces efflorescens]